MNQGPGVIEMKDNQVGLHTAWQWKCSGQVSHALSRGEGRPEGSWEGEGGVKPEADPSK